MGKKADLFDLYPYKIPESWDGVNDNPEDETDRCGRLLGHLRRMGKVYIAQAGSHNTGAPQARWIDYTWGKGYSIQVFFSFDVIIAVKVYTDTMNKMFINRNYTQQHKYTCLRLRDWAGIEHRTAPYRFLATAYDSLSPEEKKDYNQDMKEWRNEVPAILKEHLGFKW